MIKALLISMALIAISCKDKAVSINSDNAAPNEVIVDTKIEDAIETEVKAASTKAEIEAPTKKSVEDNPISVESKGKKLPEPSDSKKSKDNVTSSTKVEDPKSENAKEEKPVLPPVYVEPKEKPKDDIPVEEVDEEKAPPVKFSHDSFNTLLSKYVSANGKVNYNSIKANRSNLDAYTKSLSENPPASSWSKNEQLAYWINAYNAFTITKIVDNYPLKSIKDLDGGKPWDAKWIKIGSKTYSLNNIENDIIRPKFNDPRIHFAVNCAAKSCPPLLNKAYSASNLNSLLDNNAKKFINNEKFNQISNSNLKISKIFDWYGKDFGNLIDYLNKYATTKIDKSASVGYMEYNWSLNN